MKVWNKIKQNENLMRFIETTQKRITDSEMSTTSDEKTNRRRGKCREKQGKCPIICQNSDKKCRKDGLPLAHTTKKQNIETTSRAVTDKQSATARLFLL